MTGSPCPQSLAGTHVATTHIFFRQFLEVKVKKAHLSPVTSIAVSFSLALGILVSDVCGSRFLTAARAGNNSCHGKKVSSKHIKINNGIVHDGVAVRRVTVNGQVVHHGVIASSVIINDMTAPGVKGVLVGDNGPAPAGAASGDGSVCRDGVLVGDNSPVAITGVLVGDNSPVAITGVLVGDNSPVATNGVLVGDNSPTPETGINAEGIHVSGAVVSIGGTASGGVLVGDNITISNGVITGENLVLTGSRVKGGHVSVVGSTAEVQISPAN